MANLKRVSKNTSLQAPTMGLNAKDAVANMKPKFATTIENWFPTPSSVDVRKGYVSHATGLSGDVETLAAYNTGTSQRLFAAANGNIYDATASGAVGDAVVSSLSNSRFQYINMGTAGGFFLIMVNGEDRLLRYTGSAWQQDGDGSADITGVNTANIIHINNFKCRIFMVERDSFNVWYLPVASIGGTATKLDLSSFFRLGGYIMAMVNWTIDNSAGIDDYAAFITSEGEVVVYAGTDPSSASTWALQGTFRMGSPIGRRCFMKVGADVMVITVDGAFPLSKSMLVDRTQLGLALSDNISPLINKDVQDYKGNFGWQPIYHPIGNKLIVNVPVVENIRTKQYVMNTQHGAWTVYSGWNANCFETMNDTLYFGGASTVYIGDTGYNDDGGNITAVCQQAFSYFGDSGQNKKFTLARPVFLSEGTVTPAVLINTDFQETRTTVSASFSGGVGAAWDEEYWDDAEWTGGDTLTAKWQTVTGVGFSAGVRVVTSTKDIAVKWQSTDFVYELGATL